MTVVRPGWMRPHCVWLLVANALLFDGPLLFLHGIAQKGDDSERATQKVAADGPFRSMRDVDDDVHAVRAHYVSNTRYIIPINRKLPGKQLIGTVSGPQ